MQQIEGIVTVVQEGRFRLVTPDGRSKLFLLAPDADLEPQDLPALQRAQTPVVVHFTDADHILAGDAHRLTDAQAMGEPR
jgi:hypothetical protein